MDHSRTHQPPTSPESPLPPQFTGRRILVTGGARGLGAAIVAKLAEQGATGLILDIGGTPDTAPWPVVEADVTDEAALSDVLAADITANGPFDGLVAAAGIVPPWHSPENIDLSMLERTLAVNVLGFVATLKHVTPTMPRGSSVVAIGSLNSWRGDPNVMAYVASKHAVLGAVRSAALSLGSRGIRVNAVAPGPVATEALRSRMDSRSATTGATQSEALAAAAALTSLGSLATADDIADAVLFLAGPHAAAITGQLLPVDGGLL